MGQRLGANLQWPTVTEPIISPAPEHAAAASPAAARSPDGTPPPGVAYPKTIKSFVRRAGRTTTGQAKAFEDLGPRFVLPYAAAPLDAAAAFGRSAPLVLEIGFGMGEATAHIARVRPDDNFLCCEVHEPGVGALLKRIGEQGLTNIRILQHDAVEVIDNMLPSACLDGIQSSFPTRGTRRSTTSAASSRRPLLPSWPSASSPAAICTAPPTGNPMPIRCCRCWAQNPCSPTPPKALLRNPITVP